MPGPPSVTLSGRRRAEDAAASDQVAAPIARCHDVDPAPELTLRSLRPERRLALEMAVDERAEVQELERQWREAEEIAEIADGTLQHVGAGLRRSCVGLKRNLGDSTVRLNFGLPQLPGGHYLRTPWPRPWSRSRPLPRL